jgi:basic membrane lipoprotein Med (substrate-binding protein (PBP1-ABC) superfamily)
MLPILRALVSSALVLSTPLALAACAKSSAPPPLRVALVADESPLGDASLNQSATAGIAAAQRLLGAEVAIMHANSRAEYRADLTLLADQDYDEVFGVGPATGGAMAQIARRYPRRNFALVGAITDEPNVTSIVFPVEQGAFLAGVLASALAGGRAIEIDSLAGSAREAALRSGFIAGLRQSGAPAPAAAGGAAADDIAPAATLYATARALSFETRPGPRRGAVLARVIERADVAVLQVCGDARSLKLPAGPTSFGIAQNGVELGLTAAGKRAAGAAGLARLARVRDAIADGRLSPPGSTAQLARFTPVAL